MKNLLLAIILLAPTSAVIAQDDFAELSAKERISLAEKEEVEAARDGQFQDMMQKGHELFKQKHYLKAIHQYEEAMEKRPYNVYPKVIIADIELSMKDTLAVLRAAEKEVEKQAPKAQPENQTREENPTEAPEETPEERMKRMNDWEKKERERLQKERERNEAKPEPSVETVDGDVKKLSIEDYQKELAEKYPSGITETTAKEGNKTIITRIVVNSGKGNEYKKVVHNWGGVFYFKNGEAVTERVWLQETE